MKLRAVKPEERDSSREGGSSESAEPKSEGSRKKIGAVAGVLGAVFIIAGAGFFVWHEQPSFCNAICHMPMDPYMSTYEAEPGGAAVDKWGNEVEDAGAMLSVTHRVNSAEATCLSCHVPTMSEQITEGVAWAAGSYEVVESDAFGVALPERSLSDLTAARGVEDEAFCLNEACHVNDDGSVMTEDDLATLTAYMNYNPHKAHIETECSDCHKAHRASVVTCTACHGTMDVPEGWLTAAEAGRVAA